MNNSGNTSNHKYLTEELQKSRQRAMSQWAEKEEWKKKYLLLKNSISNKGEIIPSPQSPQKISTFVQTKLEKIFEYAGELDNFFQNNFNSLIKKEISSKEKKIRNLQKKIEELGQDLRKSELNRLQQESDNENLKENSADLDIYRDKFIATNERIENLLKKEEEFMIRINSLQEKVSEQEEQIEELHKYPSTVSRLKHLLSQGAADFERIQDKYDNLKEKAKKQNKRNKKLKLALMEKNNKVEALNKVVAGKNRLLAKIKNEQTKIVNELKTQRDNLSDENSLLSQEIVELEKKLTQVNYDYQALQYELEKLKGKETQTNNEEFIEANEEELEDLYQENKFLYESIELLEKNNVQLEKRIEQTDESQAGSSLEQLAQILDVAKNQDYKDNPNAIIIKDVKKLKEEKKKLSGKLDNLQENLQKARNNIDELVSEKSKFELKIAFLEDENDDLSKKIKDFENNDYQEKCTQLEKRISELKTQKANLEDKINKSSGQYSNSEEKKQIKDFEKRIESLKLSCESYSKSLLEEKKQNTIVNNKLKILKDQLDDKLTRLEAGRTNLNQIMSNLDNCEFFVDSIEDSILLEKDRSNQFVAEIQSLKNQVKTNIEEKNNMIDILNSKIEEMNYKIREMDGEDNQFKIKEIKKLQEVIAQQNKQLKNLEEKNEKLETDLIVFDAKYSNFQKYVETISKVENELKLIGLMNAANELEEVAKLMTSDLRRDF